MKLCNDASRYNQQTIDFLENTAIHREILADVQRGYSSRSVARRNGINTRQLRILLRYLQKDESQTD
jgi:hypothetical protein